MSGAACPIWDLPDVVREHWDVEALCADLACPECLHPWWEDVVGWGDAATPNGGPPEDEDIPF